MCPAQRDAFSEEQEKVAPDVPPGIRYVWNIDLFSQSELFAVDHTVMVQSKKC